MIAMATFYEDYENRRNRAALASAKPDKKMRLLVRQEENRSAPAILATGIRRSGEFEVMPDTGEDAFSVPWESVLRNLSQHD